MPDGIVQTRPKLLVLHLGKFFLNRKAQILGFDMR